MAMDSVPNITPSEQAPPSDDRRPSAEVRVAREGHKERIRASLEWALEEFAGTLAKLAK